MTHIEFMHQQKTTIDLIDSLIDHLQKEILKHQQSWSYRELKEYTDSITFLQQRREIKIKELC